MNYNITQILQEKEIEIKKLDYESIDPRVLDLSILSEADQQRFHSFQSEKRQLEFYFTRVLLREFPVSQIISYRPSGRPVIEEGHISISHARNTIVIAHCPNKIPGVDIEFFSPKIERIKHKFLASSEEQFLDKDPTLHLTIIWSLKEAIYKMKDQAGLIFKEHILIKSLQSPGIVDVYENESFRTYTFFWLPVHSGVITYCLPSDN